MEKNQDLEQGGAADSQRDEHLSAAARAQIRLLQLWAQLAVEELQAQHQRQGEVIGGWANSTCAHTAKK